MIGLLKTLTLVVLLTMLLSDSIESRAGIIAILFNSIIALIWYGVLIFEIIEMDKQSKTKDNG